MPRTKGSKNESKQAEKTQLVKDLEKLRNSLNSNGPYKIYEKGRAFVL